jgi:hypothetical protein
VKRLRLLTTIFFLSSIAHAGGEVGGSGIFTLIQASSNELFESDRTNGNGDGGNGIQSYSLAGGGVGGSGIWTHFRNNLVKFESIDDNGIIQFQILHEGAVELLEVDETDLIESPELEDALFNSFSKNNVDL